MINFLKKDFIPHLIYCSMVLIVCALNPSLAQSENQSENKTLSSKSVPYHSNSQLGQYLLGQHAIVIGDIDTALRALDLALSQDPNNGNLLKSLLNLSLQKSDFDKALTYAKKLQKLSIPSDIGNLLLALKEFKSNNPTKSLEFLKSKGDTKFIEKISPFLQTWINIDKSKDKKNLYLDLEQKLLSFNSVNDKKEDDEFIPFQLGLLADVLNQNDQAYDYYGKFLKFMKQPPVRMIEIIGNFYQRYNKTNEAEELYKKATTLNPQSLMAATFKKRLAGGKNIDPVITNAQEGLAETLFYLAALLSVTNNNQEASVIMAELSLFIKPQVAHTQFLLGELFRSQELYNEALKYYRSVGSNSIFSTVSQISTAQILDKMGKTDEAIALLEKFLNTNPGEIDVAMVLGEILSNQKLYQQAINAYNKAISQINTPLIGHWNIFYARGIAYERNKQWDKAEEDLQKALVLNPEEPLILNYLGYSWVDRGENLDKALAMLKKAVELDPNNGYIIDSLGWAFFRLKNWEEATKYLEKATELSPSDPTINDHLGDAYWKASRLNEAKFQWQRALLFKPENDQIVLIQKKLQEGIK
ncbi:MAG: tetratricopeptide repeat protein [Alphaproteobacteria bacterium]|nr:tetratricopeptide repeat protein [Alphaproteobacteria bacterium]